MSLPLAICLTKKILISWLKWCWVLNWIDDADDDVDNDTYKVNEDDEFLAGTL